MRSIHPSPVRYQDCHAFVVISAGKRYGDKTILDLLPAFLRKLTTLFEFVLPATVDLLIQFGPKSSNPLFSIKNWKKYHMSCFKAHSIALRNFILGFTPSPDVSQVLHLRHPKLAFVHADHPTGSL